MNEIIVGLIIAAIAACFKQQVIDTIMLMIRRIKAKRKAIPSRSEAFYDLKSLINDKLPTLNVYCPMRRAICQAVLKCKYRVVLEFIEEVSNDNYNKYTASMYKSYWENSLNRLAHHWRAQLREIDVPDIVIESFVSLEEQQEKILEAYMYGIISTDLLVSYEEKTRILIDFIGILSKLSLNAMQATMEKLNGQLDDIGFKGMNCGNCTITCVKRTKNV